MASTFKFADGVQHFMFFSSGGGGEFANTFREAAKEISKAKKTFGMKDLVHLIHKHQFEHDWYSSNRKENHLRNILHAQDMPIMWSKEYREFVDKHDGVLLDAKKMAEKNLLIEKMKSGDSKGARPFENKGKSSAAGAGSKRVPAGGAGPGRVSNGGAGPARVSAGGAAPARVSNGGAGLAPAPAGGAGADVVDITEAASPACLQLLTPGAKVLAMLADDKKKVLYLAVPPADFETAKTKLDDKAIEYEQFCLSTLDEDDNDDEKASVNNLSKFFDETFGYNNYMRSLVTYEKPPTKADLPDELNPFIVPQQLIHARFSVAIDQHDDAGAKEKARDLKEIRDKFLRPLEIQFAMSTLAEERTRVEQERLRQEQERVKAEFLNTFMDQTTADEINARHAVFVDLRQSLSIMEPQYLNLMQEQTRDIMQKAGVIQQGYNTILLNRQDMEAKLTPFSHVYPAFTDGVIKVYLDERDRNIELAMKAADFDFNQKFEAEHNGKSLKEYIEGSASPGIWVRFAKEYDHYLGTKKLKDAHAQLIKQLQAGGKRRRNQSPSPSPQASGEVSPHPEGSPSLVGIQPPVPGQKMSRQRKTTIRFRAGPGSRKGSPGPVSRMGSPRPVSRKGSPGPA